MGSLPEIGNHKKKLVWQKGDEFSFQMGKWNCFKHREMGGSSRRSGIKGLELEISVGEENTDLYSVYINVICGM